MRKPPIQGFVPPVVVHRKHSNNSAVLSLGITIVLCLIFYAVDSRAHDSAPQPPIVVTPPAKEPQWLPASSHFESGSKVYFKTDAGMAYAFTVVDPVYHDGSNQRKMLVEYPGNRMDVKDRDGLLEQFDGQMFIENPAYKGNN